MHERQSSQSSIEAPYVRVARDIVDQRIPEHQDAFNTVLTEINQQITGEGLSVWESVNQPGVSFLAGHLSITPEIIRRVSAVDLPETAESSLEESRLDNYVYFLQPSFGFGNEGNVFSILGYGIDRFIREMPKVARAMKMGEKPPKITIHLLGNPKAFGGTVTQEYVDGVREKGFSEQGRLYSEYMEDRLKDIKLSRARIVIQATSKGTITSDKTFDYLSDEIKDRTQLLFDNPAGDHETSVLESTLRAYNLGLGSLIEATARRRFGLVRRESLSDRSSFYEMIALLKDLPEDSKEQRDLKMNLLLKGELWNIAKGTPLNSNHRSYTRTPALDSLRIDLGNAARLICASASGSLEPYEVESLETEENDGGVKIKGRRGLIVKHDDRRLIFSTAHFGHQHPWERGIRSGSWKQKMNYVKGSSKA